ncbi:hypothetical protein [Halospeciosus flavus]|uniref:hypothetical protein n=1 Tax=Halospeciosus flavus TaxID=3032283 RepID=UPI00360EDF26
MLDQDIQPSPPFSDPCVVHDPITFRGGGEQYAAELAAVLDAPLYTYQKSDDIRLNTDVTVDEFGDPGFLDQQALKTPIRRVHRVIEYENFEVPEQHDAVITTGEISKSLLHHPYQRRYHLLHTPARWLFDRGPAQYKENNWPIRWAKQLYQSVTRIHDQSTIPRVDDFVVNSEIIARRLETYHRREATTVIYPPIDLESYYHKEDRGFLLYLGRLEPHKRVGAG